MINIVFKTGPVGWTGSTVTPSLKLYLCDPKKMLKAVRTGNFKNSVYKFSYVSTIVSLVLCSYIKNSFFSFNEPWFSWIFFFFWETLIGSVNRLDYKSLLLFSRIIKVIYFFVYLLIKHTIKMIVKVNISILKSTHV